MGGIVIIVTGLPISIFTGFSLLTREKVVDMIGLQIFRNKRHTLALSSVPGIAVMLAGGVLTLVGTKKGQIVIN